MDAELFFDTPIIFDVSCGHIAPPGGHIAPPDGTLFLASDNRGKPNDGLPISWKVTFPYNTVNYKYIQLLSDSEEQPFKLWKFRYDIMYSSDAVAQMNQKFFVTKREADGSMTNYPLMPYEDLDQTLSTAREFRYPVDIDGDIGLRFTLMADTKVRFYMWMDKNASLTNKLLTNESVFEFTKPFPLEAKNPYLVKIIWGEQGSFYVEK